jgi:hypothetical protein
MRRSGSRRIITVLVGLLTVIVVVFLAVGLIFEDSRPGQMLQGAAVQSEASQPPPEEGIVVDSAVVLTEFTVAWTSTEQGAMGMVLRWETASEVDNLGFNIYRASNQDGPWTMLNKQLIPSLVPPGGPVGAGYEWTDREAKQGQNIFYLLEDVDVNGTATKHGPVAP